MVSGSRKNALGYPTGFVLESHGHANPLLKKADFRRAGFIEHALWVTAFDADERFAAGDTPNQNPDEPGLPRYVADNESIVNRDIVLWHTVSFHHVTAAEDYPVLTARTRVVRAQAPQLLRPQPRPRPPPRPLRGAVSQGLGM